jgi:hypothetical protein
MSIADSIVPGLPGVAAIIEDDTLIRSFAKTLFGPQIWRSEATEIEMFEPQMGVSKTHTRDGRMEVDERPARAGVDPSPQTFGTEQWVYKLQPYNGTTDINLLVNRVALASTFTQRVEKLGLQAGETINRLPRNALYRAYGTGTSLVDVGVVAGTTFTVNSIAGFLEQLNSDGVLATTASGNSKPFFVNGVLASVSIIGAVAADTINAPYGRGTITTSGNITVSTNDIIKAQDAPLIVYSGNGASVDAITTSNVLQLRDIRKASAYLSDNSVPRHSDGFYHCHLADSVTASLFNDSELQALNDGRFGDVPYRNMMLGILMGCIFISNPEVPRVGAGGASSTTSNVGTLQESRPTNHAGVAYVAPLIGIEMINRNGVAIMRTIITGCGALVECPCNFYPDVSEAGFSGVMTSFKPITSLNISANTMGVSLILAVPLDRLGQWTRATWAWSGDFACPSDALGGLRGNPARFKRAVVIVSADPTY